MSEEEVDADIAANRFVNEATDLYLDINEQWRKTAKCTGAKTLSRSTYRELRAAFLPTRTIQTVKRACDKIADSAGELLTNSDLINNALEPSCHLIGLDTNADEEDKTYNRCHWAGTNQQPMLVCDCPDGYGEYTAKDYAEEHMIKCVDNQAWIHYSDFPQKLARGYRAYVAAKDQNDVSGMVIGCDAMINAVHARGTMAQLFVVGGKHTLDRLLETRE